MIKKFKDAVKSVLPPKKEKSIICDDIVKLINKYWLDENSEIYYELFKNSKNLSIKIVYNQNIVNGKNRLGIKENFNEFYSLITFFKDIKYSSLSIGKIHSSGNLLLNIVIWDNYSNLKNIEKVLEKLEILGSSKEYNL